jgi:hypothetical protein
MLDPPLITSPPATVIADAVTLDPPDTVRASAFVDATAKPQPLKVTVDPLVA